MRHMEGDKRHTHHIRADCCPYCNTKGLNISLCIYLCVVCVWYARQCMRVSVRVCVCVRVAYYYQHSFDEIQPSVQQSNFALGKSCYEIASIFAGLFPIHGIKCTQSY